MTLVMLAISAMLIGLTFYSGRQMDYAADVRERALVDNALTGRLNNGLRELRSVAWWDDALLYASQAQFDRDWLDQEIGSYMKESYGHDRIMILDENDHIAYVYGEYTGIGAPQLRADLAGARSVIAQARGGRDASPRVKSTAKPGELYETAGNSVRRFSRGFGAIVQIDGKPAFALASLITPSFESSLNPPKRRIVLTVIDITPEVLSTIGKSVLLDDLSHYGGKDNRTGRIDFKTDSGGAMQPLRWSAKRPGTAMVNRVLPFILSTLAIISLLMAYLFVRLFHVARSLADRERDARHQANHDSLTGLPNRRKLEAELVDHPRNASVATKRLTCAIIDLDRFKDINDTLGHAAGDALIIAVGERLRSTLRPGDFVARLGGDEFAVLCECETLACADDLSSRILAAFVDPFPVLGHQIETGASIGIALSRNGRFVEDLMREADIALYEAKAHHKGSSVRFAPAMANQIEQRRMLEIDLKHAIADRELTMVYQPIIDANTGMICSVEALVRWNSEKHGMVRPDVFVAIAEETGLMADLGRLIIDQAIEDTNRWPHLQTAINISPAQLRSSSILDDLARPARQYGVPASQIMLEITETVLLSNDRRTNRILHVLKELGFGLSLDDFGSGYSGLSYIRDFPFDMLKIDRSFVTGRDASDRSVEIVKAVVNFGRILGREVVAEGIETEQEMQAMQRAGVTHLQGYLFSKPLSAPHIEALVATSGRLTVARTRGTEPSIPFDRTLAKPLRHIAG